MASIKKILCTDSYWQVTIQNDLYHEVQRYLEANNLTSDELAERLGVSKRFIKQALNGNFDGRLSRLVDLSIAIGKAPVLQFRDLEEVIEEEIKP